MEALRSADEIRDVNTRYHDVAAESYDSKWGIDFGDIGRQQVLGKLRKLLGSELDAGYERSLEIGAGTGYFSLNMLRAGVVREATCTDISPGMVATLSANAERLGLTVRAARADAESLPFADQSFDLVLGHAVLHHLPNLRRAFTEFHRVLRPGGRIVFAGEPSRVGDRIASLPKRGANALRAGVAAADRRQPRPAAGRRRLRSTPTTMTSSASSTSTPSTPSISRAMPSAPASRRSIVRGEELAANWFGWFNRGLEASADPADVPMLWRRYAFHGYLMLQRVDEKLLEPVLPPAIFYNLLLTARRP